MSDSFVYGGIDSNNFGVLLLSDVMEGTEYDYTSISVPGRTGDLHRGNNRYKNTKRELIVFAGEQAEQRLSALNESLLSLTGYQRLQTSSHPDWYTQGQYTGGMMPRQNPGFTVGRASLNFDCKPQKWLVSGENTISVSDGDTITNPTLYPSKPLLMVTGQGTLTIGRYSIEVLEDVTDMAIDCDMEKAYSTETAENYNGKIRVYLNDFLLIQPGENEVTLSSGMTLSVVPRWWTL